MAASFAPTPHAQGHSWGGRGGSQGKDQHPPDVQAKGDTELQDSVKGGRGSRNRAVMTENDGTRNTAENPSRGFSGSGR